MFTTVRITTIIIYLLILAIPAVFAQIPPSFINSIPVILKTETSIEKNSYLINSIYSSINDTKNSKVFLNFINKQIHDALDEKDEKRILRRQWQELLNVDIFYPYFKIKEVEEWVGEKASVKFFNMKGVPKFENNSIKYTFKVKF